MNKEVKELIEQINRRWNYLKPPYMSLKKEEIDLFIDYINQLETNIDVLKEYIQDLRYNIEPEGVRINFNCEYDSEEDYIRGMEEQAKLEILKAILSKMQELERGKE